jgi:hypothetical protein
VRSQQDSRTAVGIGSRAAGKKVRATGFHLLSSDGKAVSTEKISQPEGEILLAASVRTRISVGVDRGDADELLEKVRDGIHSPVESQDEVNVWCFQ